MRRYLIVLVALPFCLVYATAQAPNRYQTALERLDKIIEREVKEKNLPALSVAFLDDQKLVWAKGYGFADRGRTRPATAETIYRVGSVSKLFTDVAVMQLVEEGKVDLDAPVSKYLPNFQPKLEKDHKPITLRMLMAHRSGLLREPPAGSYFDDSGTTLSATVESFQNHPVVYAPGERTKYSNAGIAVVGEVLAKVTGQRFEDAVKQRVLEPLGMTSSAFEATPAVKRKLAEAIMWTYHGREFPAPTFDMGMGPAGSLYAPVTDIARFAACVFADGKVGDKQLIKPETLQEMLKPQYSKDGRRGFGLGFSIGELDGKKRVGHGGAVYGFATELAMLPEEKLAFVVVASRDVANTVTTRLALHGLKLALAAKAGKPLPDDPQTTEPVPVNEAKKLAGKYVNGDNWIELTETNGNLYLWFDRGGDRVELRKRGDHLWGDGVLSWGPKVEVKDDRITVEGKTYTRDKSTEPPAPPPQKWLGLIGEYGWDHNILVIFEWHGKLYALIEWTEVDPLTEITPDEYAFPANAGMYHGEKIIFTRDATGRATKAVASGVTFARRKMDGENGETFRIESRRPIDFIKLEALVSDPPEENRPFRDSELVDLEKVEPTLKFDIRYASKNNFLNEPFYTSARAFLQQPAAAAVKKVHAKLKEQGLGLIIYDAYRPWHVTRMFWDATPTKFRNFVADPLQGSRHNRGCAVDLGLFDLKTGKPIPVVGGYDEFSDRSYPGYPGGTTRQRWYRELLRKSMESEGFTVYEAEWWHFDYKDWKEYPILNLTFEELSER